MSRPQDHPVWSIGRAVSSYIIESWAPEKGIGKGVMRKIGWTGKQ